MAGILICSPIADLPTSPDTALNTQARWAVWFYKAFGYWNRVTGALATWGIVAGLDSGQG